MFDNKVVGSKESYSKRQIKVNEQTRGLYESLGYPSVIEYKSVKHINQTKDCPVTVQDIYVVHNIWGKSVPYFKGNITSQKPIPVEGDLVQVPEELVKLHKDIYLTADLLFVNGIPLLITLRRKICFTAVNHLSNRKMKTIFKGFKNICSC